MKAPPRPRTDAALTLLEVMLVIACIVVFVGMLVPAFTHKPQHHRSTCVNNLKNIGLAFRIFSTDNDGKYPRDVPASSGGSAEFPLDVSNAWKQFAVLSNELSTPKILICSEDSERLIAANFASFGNANLSYFLGLEATEEVPQSILGGDRNVTTNGVEVEPGLLRLGTNHNTGFSKKIHKDAGNILLGDGSVQQVTSLRFREAVVAAAASSNNGVNRLLIP